MIKRLTICIFVLLLLSANAVRAKMVYTFEGEIDFEKDQYDLTVNLPRQEKKVVESTKSSYAKSNLSKSIKQADSQSSIFARARRNKNNDLQLSMNIGYLQTPMFDISSELESVIKITSEHNGTNSSSKDASTLTGRIWSKNSLLDYKPLRELSGRFEVKNNKLYFDNISFGNIVSNGYIQLKYPFKLNVTVNIALVDMDDFLNFWIRNKKYDSAGPVSGVIKVTGDVVEPYLKGHLKSYDGYVKNLKFDSINLNIEGPFPHMKISQSSVTEQEGFSFFIDGDMDLSDQKNFKRQIKNLTLSPMISADESQREVVFKRVKIEDNGTMEFKYMLRQGDGSSIDSVDLENELDMLGFEQKMKF